MAGNYDVDKPLDASGYVHILDMSDIEAPVEVARYEVPDAGAHNMWIEDDITVHRLLSGGIAGCRYQGRATGQSL